MTGAINLTVAVAAGEPSSDDEFIVLRLGRRRQNSLCLICCLSRASDVFGKSSSVSLSISLSCHLQTHSLSPYPPSILLGVGLGGTATTAAATSTQITCLCQSPTSPARRAPFSAQLFTQVLSSSSFFRKGCRNAFSSCIVKIRPSRLTNSSRLFYLWDELQREASEPHA